MPTSILPLHKKISTGLNPKVGPQLEFHQLPDWLTVEELARYLRIGRSCAYELVRSGEIPSRRFGRLIRINRASLGHHEVSA